MSYRGLGVSLSSSVCGGAETRWRSTLCFCIYLPKFFSASRFNEEVQVTGRRRTSVLFISITKLGEDNSSNVLGCTYLHAEGFL